MPRNRTPVVTGIRNSVNNQGRISDCERIKRIWNWHADTGRAKPYAWFPSFLNGSGVNGTAARDESKNERAILKSAKYRQVLVADIPRKRAVKHLAIRRRQRWRESREVKEQVVPVPRRTVYNAGYRTRGSIKWRSRNVRSRMRRRSPVAEKQSGNQTLTLALDQVRFRCERRILQIEQNCRCWKCRGHG